MIKVVINPEFEYLRSYIEAIPMNFESVGKLMDARRNIIREDNPLETHIVIKSFKRIYLPNRIRYSFFYPSKAQRAFDYGLTILERGFLTPRPIAYIETARYGLIHETYFICEYTDFKPLNQVKELTSGINQGLMKDLAQHTYHLHAKNICHQDYSAGNILYKKINGESQFSLVDNNRMKLGPVNFKQGIRNLVKIDLSYENLVVLAGEYTRLSNGDNVTGLGYLFQYKKKELAKRRRKQSLKSLVPFRKKRKN